MTTTEGARPGAADSRAEAQACSTSSREMQAVAIRPPQPDPMPCPGGCGTLRPWTWAEGYRRGVLELKSMWVRPRPDGCPDCARATVASKKAEDPTVWPPARPSARCCAHSDCDEQLSYAWHDGPATGPAHERGFWIPPAAHLCPAHEVERAENATREELAAKLSNSGLPSRLQCYSWDTTTEYRDSDGNTVTATQAKKVTPAAFLKYQAALEPGVLGITPWNKSLALKLRHVCTSGNAVQSMIIMGPVGSGKSTLMAATVTGLIARGTHCHYVTEADLWTMVRQQWSKTSKKSHQGQDVIQQLVDMPVLVIDDLGTIESPRPWHIDGMERLVCGRYDNGRPLLITTNHTLAELAGEPDSEGNKTVGYGERVVSRLSEMIGRTQRYYRLGGPDWRTGNLRASDPAPAATPAAEPCGACGELPDECRCLCSECGFSPCRGGGSCQ